MRRIVFLAGVTMVAAAVVAFGGYFVGAFTESDTPSVVPDVTPLGPPTVDDGQKQEALQLAAGNQLFREFFADRNYTVAEIGPWHNSELELIGVGMILVLNEPKSFGLTDWPKAIWDEETDSYSEGVLRFGATDVTEVHVLVDLTKRKVVEIRPEEYGAIELPPDVTPGSPSETD